MTFLDCTPSKQSGYVDEADQFFKNPKKWLNGSFKKKQENLPSHLIFFDILFQVCIECKRKLLHFI